MRRMMPLFLVIGGLALSVAHATTPKNGPQVGKAALGPDETLMTINKVLPDGRVVAQKGEITHMFKPSAYEVDSLQLNGTEVVQPKKRVMVSERNPNYPEESLEKTFLESYVVARVLSNGVFQLEDGRWMSVRSDLNGLEFEGVEVNDYEGLKTRDQVVFQKELRMVKNVYSRGHIELPDGDILKREEYSKEIAEKGPIQKGATFFTAFGTPVIVNKVFEDGSFLDKDNEYCKIDHCGCAQFLVDF